MFLILPNKQSNADHNREYTSFAHLLDDYYKDTNENDTTHIGELLSLYDSRYYSVSKEQFQILLKSNYKYRCAHHHVYSASILKEICVFFDMEILYCSENWDNIYLIGRTK
jgi:hypothetical protein